MNARRLLTLICLLMLTCPGTLHAGAPDIVTSQYMIESDVPGIRLFVRNKHPTGMTHFQAARTLLYVHGATQAASSTFDLPVSDESWMDYIAKRGFDVFLVDLRGYGRSSRPPEMSKPADENPPVVRTDVAVADVHAAVQFILSSRKLKSLDLMGWSWGTSLVGRYASEHKDSIRRLVLFAPLWLHDPPQTQPAAPPGAYRTWTMADVRKTLQSGAPEARRQELLPSAVFAAWSAAELSTDTEGTKQNPPVVRTPAGVTADDREFWSAGKALWDPTEVIAPTLVIVGEWDGVTPVAGAQAVFNKLLHSPQRRLVQIGEGTHLLLLEKNRLQLYREVQLFLED